MPPADLPRIATAIAASPEGALIAETLAERVAPEWQGHAESVWRQRDGRCVNLDDDARACALHRAGGLAALPSSCRNFPRWVTALPDRIEAAFTLTCPTAARLLATDTAPWAMEVVPPDAAESWSYHATRRVAGEVPTAWDTNVPLAAALALRDAWWAAIDRARDDAAALVVVLARMQTSPLDPDATGGTLATELPGGVAQVALSALERLPERGAYAGVRWETFAELVQPLSRATLVWAIEPAPGLLARFMSHGIQWLAVHDPRPARDVVALVALRALLVARLVDALCTRVPYPLLSLYRDAFSAASFVGA